MQWSVFATNGIFKKHFQVTWCSLLFICGTFAFNSIRRLVFSVDVHWNNGTEDKNALERKQSNCFSIKSNQDPNYYWRQCFNISHIFSIVVTVRRKKTVKHFPVFYRNFFLYFKVTSVRIFFYTHHVIGVNIPRIIGL